MRSNWFITQLGDLIDLDFFYAFTSEDNNKVFGHKAHGEQFILGEFSCQQECKEYIKYIREKINKLTLHESE